MVDEITERMKIMQKLNTVYLSLSVQFTWVSKLSRYLQFTVAAAVGTFDPDVSEVSKCPFIAMSIKREVSIIYVLFREMISFLLINLIF